ncbi:MAG: FAD-binding oxidoreductase [Candidatus Omnitrophica bacterium]|nr:FAD-binding oxidoreductase [Candidatus Omnitrophota bacterium]MCM8802586.1 FAD-binding oxidoreductase [Candidatus Omnitrophota bacterium]
MKKEIILKFKEILGEKNLIYEKERMLDYSHDEVSLSEIYNLPDVVLKPENSIQISEIIKVCNFEKIPVIARGGGTGLSGGCIPVYGGVVIDSENMKKVIEVDKENFTITVEAGLTLKEFYDVIGQYNMFFPPHPGDESATIGGLIATNAGGARAVKYGVMRNFVRGIEVVLADGSIENIGGKYKKSSSGYSLLNLFIGSEGTLGIITKATISLMPPLEKIYTLIVPFENLQQAIKNGPLIIQNGIIPLAIEFLEKTTVKLVEKYLNKKWPCEIGNTYLMIMVDGSQDETLKIAEKIAEIVTENGALDVFIIEDEKRQREVLDIRSMIYEALKSNTIEILDVSVPISKIYDFVCEVKKIEKKYSTYIPTYGHAGDGNVHNHIMKGKFEEDKWIEIENWREKYKMVKYDIYSVAKKLDGIISGEHGIGYLKKEYLGLFFTEKQIEIMKEIKKIFDPNNILNPGKIFEK